MILTQFHHAVHETAVSKTATANGVVDSSLSPRKVFLSGKVNPTKHPANFAGKVAKLAKNANAKFVKNLFFSPGNGGVAFKANARSNSLSERHGKMYTNQIKTFALTLPPT